MTSSLKDFSNESLIEAYTKAKEMNLDKAFIALLKKEIDRREITDFHDDNEK